MQGKLRLLYVRKILFEKSDEQTPLSSTDISNYLKEHGIICDKKSIYSDINELKAFGDDIIVVESPKRGFAIVSRDFEMPEVRLLSDAVKSANFITQKKTQQLLDKLSNLVPKSRAKEIGKQVYVDCCVKSKNETVYYTIDTLHNAIEKGQKVKFSYKHLCLDTHTNSISRLKDFVVSPYALIWNNDHYYLVCNYDKYENTMNLRVDKISNVEQLNENSRHFSQVTEYKEYFDASDYSKKQFNMFTGEVEKVKLICNYTLLDAVIDNFGDSVQPTVYDSNNFSVEAEVAMSDGLLSWIMQYGEKITICSPECLKKMLVDKLDRIQKNYI